MNNSLETLNLNELETVNGGAWTLHDFNKSTSMGAYGTGIGGAVVGSFAGGVGAGPGFAIGYVSGYVGGAVSWAVGNMFD